MLKNQRQTSSHGTAFLSLLPLQYCAQSIMHKYILKNL